MQWPGAGISPPQPLVPGVLQQSSTAQKGQRHPGLSLGTLQHDKWCHCPHSHASLSEGASLGLGGSCRPVPGGVNGAMRSFPGEVPEVRWSTSYLECGCCKFDLTLLWTLVGDCGLLRLTCSTEDGGLAPAEKLGSDTDSGCCPHHSARDNGGDTASALTRAPQERRTHS